MHITITAPNQEKDILIYMKFVLAATAMLWSAQLHAADSLRATHDALFASFLPINGAPELQPMFLQAREGIWQAANRAPQFQALLAPFADLRNLGGACGTGDFIKSAGTTAFDQLNVAQRNRLLYLLQTCSLNDPRRLAMNVRNFYLVKTYGALQEPLTGVKLNLYAPASYVEDHRPKLPKTRLRYDRDKKEISSDGEIDYLIVGSGPAGSVLSHELRRGGKRVVLVERGPFTVPGSMETRIIDELKESDGTRTSVDGGIIIKNGNAVGGGTLVNVDLCFAPTLPSIQFKIDSWRRDGRIGASDFTLPELAKAYEWVKASIGTRVLQDSEINPNNKVLWDGAKLMGLHPKLYDLNTYAPGKSPFPVTDKRSAAEQLVLKALQDNVNPLSFVPDAEVRRVLFDDHMKATGVEIVMHTPLDKPGVTSDPNGLGISAGEKVTIHARNVILSAGSLSSPAILLRSGVKNDQIGRGAVLHVALPLMGLFDQTIDVLQGTQASVFVDDYLISDGYALEAMSAEPLYAALMSPGPPEHAFQMIKSYRHLGGFGVMLIDTPSPDNRVVLDSKGEPQVEYTISEADKIRFRKGVALAARIVLKAGAKEVYLPTTEDILGDGTPGELHPVVITNAAQADAIEKKMQFISNRTMMSTAHLQATNKMGASIRDSVVGRDFHVWGTERLYVVDGSVFPTSIGANPMQSIYTFAKIFADHMNK